MQPSTLHRLPVLCRSCRGSGLAGSGRRSSASCSATLAPSAHDVPAAGLQSSNAAISALARRSGLDVVSALESIPQLLFIRFESEGMFFAMKRSREVLPALHLFACSRWRCIVTSFFVLFGQAKIRDISGFVEVRRRTDSQNSNQRRKSQISRSPLATLASAFSLPSCLATIGWR